MGPCAGPSLQRVQYNLQHVGGAEDPAGEVWISDQPPPQPMPSIALGDEPGTLGPRSYGFLNNIAGIAPLAAPIQERPRQGGIAVVVGRRDALPEMIPLLNRRGLGISWLISVGDGDPADALQFLMMEPHTTGVLLALGRGARAASLHTVSISKPLSILERRTNATGEEGLIQAVVRRAGATVASSMEEWLTVGELLALSPSFQSTVKKVQIYVCGAGGEFIESEAAAAGLPVPTIIDLDNWAEEVPAAPHDPSELTLLCGDRSELEAYRCPKNTIRVDVLQTEQLRAIFRTVARYLDPPDRKTHTAQLKPNKELVAKVMEELPPPLFGANKQPEDERLSDHDAKRLLHAYGVRVTKQAPAANITAAQRLATKIGLPVVLIAPQEADVEVACHSQAELRRQATLLLSRANHILVREQVESGPRIRASVSNQPGVGQVATVHGQVALLPLAKWEAKELAEQVMARHELSGSPQALTDFLLRVTTCALDLQMSCALEFAVVTNDPIVIKAQAVLKRPRSSGG